MTKQKQTASDSSSKAGPASSAALEEGAKLSLNDILSSEKVADSPEEIKNSQSDFLKWIDVDLKILESSYAQLAKKPEAGREHALEIQKAAFSCKEQAGAFGFELGSAIAKSLYEFLEKDYVEGDPNHVIVIRKHIDTLNTIFHQGVAGDGGEIGLAVHNALGKLIHKFDVG